MVNQVSIVMLGLISGSGSGSGSNPHIVFSRIECSIDITKHTNFATISYVARVILVVF